MDKGFNDDELADIMSEIENLEKEFTQEIGEQPKAEVKEAPQHQEQPAQEHKVEQTEIVEQVAQMPVEDVEKVVTSKAHDDENVHHIQKPEVHTHEPVNSVSHSLPESSLNFSVQGDMKLNLFFNIGGKSVELKINESGFDIQLDGGMKFSIPIDPSEFKKAA